MRDAYHAKTNKKLEQLCQFQEKYILKQGKLSGIKFI